MIVDLFLGLCVPRSHFEGSGALSSQFDDNVGIGGGVPDGVLL